MLRRKAGHPYDQVFLSVLLSFSTISLEVRYSLCILVVSGLFVSWLVFSFLSRIRFLNDSYLGIFEQAEHISSGNVPSSAALKQLLLRNAPVVFSCLVSFKTKKGSR